jgi:hypothetical protein
MVWLILSEWTAYTQTDMVAQIIVDPERDQLMNVNINMTLHTVPCHQVDVRVVDVSGVDRVVVSNEMLKHNLDKNSVVGNAVSVNSWDRVEGATGCNLHGHVMVMRVAGLVQLSVHGNATLSFDHTIHQLSFDPIDSITQRRGFLDGVHHTPTVESVQYRYFIKIVGSRIHRLGHTETYHDYAATFHEKQEQSGIHLQYETSPILIQHTKVRKSLTSFFTDACSIIGGVYILSGMVDALLYKWDQHAHL